jgi:hypothetical protein
MTILTAWPDAHLAAANMLDLKDERGIIGSGTLSSNISVNAGPPWNMLGTILSESGAMQWSNGTQ